jgi:F-type H+/Na+-transporting ATPase subunit beta
MLNWCSCFATTVPVATRDEWAIAESMAQSLHSSSSRKDTTHEHRVDTGGCSLLGRVLNSNGEPIDPKDRLADASLRSLYEPDTQRTKVEPSSMGVLETGIKVLDLLAPASHGSVIGMMAEPGLGLLVVAEELMNNLITHHQAVLVTAGTGETTYDASMLREVVRDIGAEDRTVMLFEQSSAAVPMHQRLLRAAMTVAEHFEEEGNEVLLVIDRHLVNPATLADVRLFAAAKGVTGLLFAPMDEFEQPFASARQVGRRNQPIVSCSNDDSVKLVSLIRH